MTYGSRWLIEKSVVLDKISFNSRDPVICSKDTVFGCFLVKYLAAYTWWEMRTRLMVDMRPWVS